MKHTLTMAYPWKRTPSGSELTCAHGYVNGIDVAVIGGLRVPCAGPLEAGWFAQHVCQRGFSSLDELEDALKPEWAQRVREARET